MAMSSAEKQRDFVFRQKQKGLKLRKVWLTDHEAQHVTSSVGLVNAALSDSLRAFIAGDGGGITYDSELVMGTREIVSQWREKAQRSVDNSKYAGDWSRSSRWKNVNELLCELELVLVDK